MKEGEGGGTKRISEGNGDRETVEERKEIEGLSSPDEQRDLGERDCVYLEEALLCVIL